MRSLIALLAFLVGWSSTTASLAGMDACTRNTPIGVACFCNGRIIASKPHPGWQQQAVYKPVFVRPGWHITFIKGQHGEGLQCYRDREATAEERARFLKTGF
jgi:hypothetical protein